MSYQRILDNAQQAIPIGFTKITFQNCIDFCHKYVFMLEYVYLCWEAVSWLRLGSAGDAQFLISLLILTGNSVT